MKKKPYSGLVASLIGLFDLSIYLQVIHTFQSFSGPIRHYKDWCFSLVWGFGVAESIGYAYAILLTIAVCIICFAIGHKLSSSGCKQP